MSKDYWGKMLFVDLTTGNIQEKTVLDKMSRQFLGCSGLGVRILYETMKPEVDPLGPDNIIGFAPGVLTATGAPMSSRYEVFAKSPLTNAWGQANSGGYFGKELKCAGYDAVFFTGISPKPAYLLINDGNMELRDATHLWGRDTIETEEILRNEIGDRLVRIASIGPAGELTSLISCVINDGGRAAGRSGLGAVMGSKRLKAIAVRGKKKIETAQPERVKALRDSFLQNVRNVKDVPPNILKNYGTCGSFKDFIIRGDAPVKNWSLNGIEAFPTADKLHGESVTKYQTRKYACFDCPIGCGGIVRISAGPHQLPQGHKPEYETLAGLGSLCCNDDVESIIMANDICNRYGIDTISAGNAVAFAIECFENNVISRQEADGIELTWGNASAILAILNKIARREGFGKVLADGVKRAAETIGRGSEKYAVHIFGEEPGLRDPRFVPSRGVGYIADPAPGRHTASTFMVVYEQFAPLGSFPELLSCQKDATNKAESYAISSKYQAMANSAGLCFFSLNPGMNYPIVDFISAVTGWDFTIEEALRTGHRIQTLRQAFTLREGISPSNFRLPDRMSKTPKEGPLAGKAHDFNALRNAYYEAMEWESQGSKAGYPRQQTLRKLDLNELIAKFGTY